MRTRIRGLAGGALVVVGPTLHAQQRVPVIDLPPSSTTSIETLGSVIGVRPLPDGGVLVDDGERRQLRRFDQLLAHSTIVLDSASGASNSYGRRPAVLIAYRGDSTVFPDYAAHAMLVLDGSGRIARTLSLPNPNDVGLLTRGAGFDANGRLLYLGERRSLPSSKPRTELFEDSLPILRANLDSRRTDTVGRVARPLAKTSALSPDGRSTVTLYVVDPLRTVDEWAVLANGSAAVVRGHDYHIDWILPDGTTRSDAKLPFDWKRVDDADKQRIVDSTRAELERSMRDGTIIDRVERINVIRTQGGAPPGNPPSGGRGGVGGRGDAGPGGRGGGGLFQDFTIAPSDVVALDQVADYYPAIRGGAATPDLGGNLWILPTTSTQSRQGELIYDVVNARGDLFERVRVPLGRSIVGFGKDGIVYMVTGDRAHGFRLERSALPSRSGPSR